MHRRALNRQSYLLLLVCAQRLRRFLKDPFPRHPQRARVLVYALFAIILIAVTAQRANPLHYHPTFPIFRASFWHLVNAQNLYAGYGLGDRFKYSPTAALLFAPVAIPAFAQGLLIWNFVNVWALIYALDQLLPRRAATLALLLLLPEIHGAMQRSQSNSLVASLIILSFVAIEQERQLKGYLAIALGTAIKLFPLVALSFALFHPRRLRAALIFVACAIGVLLLPLLVTSPAALIAQYHWWYAIESSDTHAHGISVMGLLRHAFATDWPNLPVQLVGLLVLLAPLVRVQQWEHPRFRLDFLASLLVFVVLFNHQAERPSYLIAAAGVVIWFVASPRHPWRFALVLLSLAGINALGFLPAWGLIQFELWAFNARAPGLERSLHRKGKREEMHAMSPPGHGIAAAATVS